MLNVSADYLIGRTNTTARKGKLKTVCDFTGLSDQAAEYLSELVENRDYAKLSVINHLFKALCEDYSFYCHEKNGGEEAASSILGALFYYFEKCCYSENAWEEFVDIGAEERNRVLRTAYKQYLFDLVTEAVKNSAKDYAEYYMPRE